MIWLMNKITEEHSKKIESLITKKTFTLQDVVSLLDNLYTDNQIKYHINKYYPDLKSNLIKEYSKGGTKLEYLLKEIFPYDKIEKEFPLGERLRVDFLITAPYNIAFEYDGIQHDEYSSFFHGSKGAFNEAQYRDDRKSVLLANRGINLIRLSSLEMDRSSLEALVARVGYGAGIVLDESLLSNKEKQLLKQQEFQKLLKQAKAGELSKPKQRLQKSDSTNAYKESLKEKQKQFRKEQYQKQKQWLKENRKK
jgi:hypothetical protein